MNYSYEAKKGDTITMFAAFDDDAKKITVVGKHEKSTCFESELYY